MALNTLRRVNFLTSISRTCLPAMYWQRGIRISAAHLNQLHSQDEGLKEITVRKPIEVFEREFPDHFKDGKFISRMSYVEFIDEALVKMKELGLEKDLNTYKELLKVFPPGQFWPKKYDSGYGLFHAPQQLAAVRVLHRMQMNGLRPDKDFERIIIAAFSKQSDVWVKVVRMNFWSMKGRNVDPNPLPEVLPKEPHQLAKQAMMRMLDDPKSIVTVTNASRVPNSVDKTWIVFSQSPSQKEIIDGLTEKSTLFIEEGGMAYVGKDYLSYHLLKYYVDDEERERKALKPPADFNYNTLKVKFFGKPVREKFLEARERHYVDGAYILGICTTGTSSQDSLLSWLKILQDRNPKLSRLNVIFKMQRPSPEIVQYQENAQKEQQEQQRSDQAG